MTGSATASVEPDGASLDITVERLEATAAHARVRADAAMGRVIIALFRLGVTADDLQTRRVSLFEEFEYDSGRRERTGFRFSNSIRVTTDSVDAIADVIDAAVSAGGDDVSLSNIRFLVSDLAEVEEAVRQAAVGDAVRKAETLADWTGVQLAGVIAIEEVGFSTPRSVEPTAFAEAAAADATPIFGGAEEISASVRLTFAIF